MGFNLIFSHISRYQYVFKFSFLCWLNYFTIQLPLFIQLFSQFSISIFVYFYYWYFLRIYPMINCTYSVGSILTHNCEAAEQLRVIYILNHFIL